jgi:hypothetical protein
LAGDYLQVDETPVRMMDPEVRGRCATGYLWVAGRPGGDVIFEFHPGRGKEFAVALAGSFEGFMQRDGRLEIDNNLTGNAIRPSAIGKKNWLFIGHPQAGWRSAVIYSVIASCRRRGIDPWEYVRDVLRRLPAMKQSQVPTLLPRCWKPSDKLAN